MVWPASAEAKLFPETGVDRDTLLHAGRASITVPEGFVSAHRLYIHERTHFT